MSKELNALLLKAVYAGYKYHLAARHMTENYEQGGHDSQSNQKLLTSYFAQWQENTQQAIQLHERESR